jgi:hypothetical protein
MGPAALHDALRPDTCARSNDTLQGGNNHHYDASDLTIDNTGVTNEASISSSTFI